MNVSLPVHIKRFVWLAWGAWRTQPGKLLISALSIALGVALGYAVHLIHHSALDAFTGAVKQFTGVADRTVRGPRNGFDDQLVNDWLSLPEVQEAAPVLELEVPVQGLRAPVKWLGIDVFRQAAVTPGLLPRVADGGQPSAVFDHDSVFVSAALLQQLGKRTGDTLTVWTQAHTDTWTIAGIVPGAKQGQLLAVADIAATQQRFGRLGLISRLDLKLAQGVVPATFDAQHRHLLQSGMNLDSPDEAGSRGAAVSRAYRVNLSILALVALLTGGFLVFSTQALSVVKRRRHWALLRSLGASPGFVQWQIMQESLLIGLAGSGLGLLGGWLCAWTVLRYVGADLGAGFFQGAQAGLSIDITGTFVYAALGISASILGAWRPALDAAHTPAAQALRSGVEDAGLGPLHHHRWPWVLLVLSPLPCLAPPVFGLPLGGYLSIAMGLLGGVAAMPAMAHQVLGLNQSVRGLLSLAAHRMANAPRQVGVALAGIVASFSLVVAMAIMVHSFRQSLDTWLDAVLPAPLYLRLQAGDTAQLPSALIEQLRASQGVKSSEFWVNNPIIMNPDLPSVALIARPLDENNPGRRIPLTDPSLPLPADSTLTPVWVSEAMGDLYQYTPGRVVTLPLGNGTQTRAFVAGVWRDYSRQYGAVTMSLQRYQELSHDTRLTDAAFWPEPQTDIHTLSLHLRDVVNVSTVAPKVELMQASDIRSISLGIFDRSFAVTYLLEAAAMGIGLFGIAATFSASVMSRRHELATLQAVGATGRQLVLIIAAEGLWVAILGCIVGLLLGVGFAVVLIKVVNPQSFHWSMDLQLPWPLLLTMSTALLVCAIGTAAITARMGLRNITAHTLKEDWA